MRRKLIVPTIALVALGTAVAISARDRVQTRESKTTVAPSQSAQQALDRALAPAATPVSLRSQLDAAGVSTADLSDAQLETLLAKSNGRLSELISLLGATPVAPAERKAQGGPQICQGAQPVAIGDTVTAQDLANNGGALDPGLPFCGSDIDSLGLWYSVIGDGNQLTASTCNQADFDTSITVYCNGCDAPLCAANAEDTAGCAGFTSAATWCSAPGEEYLILVHAWNSGDEGIFDLTVSGGAKCTDPPVCLQIPEVTINEIRIDDIGGDDEEWFELCGADGQSLDGLTYVVIGDGTGCGGGGCVENVTSLTGSVIPADGHFLAATANPTAATGRIPDLTTPLQFENSDNVTHLLVLNFTGAQGDDLDLDDDCVLDSPAPWDAIVDLVAVVEDPAGGECSYGPPNVGPDSGGFPPGHLGRCETCTGGWAYLDFFLDCGGVGDACVSDDDCFGGVDCPLTCDVGGSNTCLGAQCTIDGDCPSGVCGTNGLCSATDTPGLPNVTESCPVGACCRADGSCDDVFDSADCDVAGGDTFFVDGLCSKTSCPQPPPANDECEGRIDIGDGANPLDLTSSTDSPPTEQAGCTPAFGDTVPHQDVWYNYTASCTGTLVLDTCGDANVDTRLAVYEGCDTTPPCPGGAFLACNDDHGDDAGGNSPACPAGSGLFESTLTLDVIAGNCYKLRVGTFSATSSTSPDDILNIECLASAAGACCNTDGSCTDGSNTDDCAAAGGNYQGDFTDCASTQCNDACEDRFVVGDGTTDYSNIGATTDGDATACGTGVFNDIWYNYTASCTGQVTVTNCEELGGAADHDSRIAIYDGCSCPADSLLECNDDDPLNPCGSAAGGFHSTALADVVSGNCYKIRVGGFSTADDGSGTLNISCNTDVSGACCLGDGCLELAAPEGLAECEAQGGTWNGYGTDCATTLCCPASSCANNLLTQSTDTVIPFGSLVCSGDGSDATALARCYDISAELGIAASASVTLNSVTFVVENWLTGPGAEPTPIDVNVYSDVTCSPPSLGTATLLATEQVLIPIDVVLPFTVTVPLTAAPVVTGSDFVVVSIQDASDNTFSNELALGANDEGECGPTYILCPGLGFTDFTDIDGFGFTDINLVQNVDISCAECGNGVVESGEDCEAEEELLANGNFDSGGGWFQFGNAFIDNPDGISLSPPQAGKMFGNFSGGFDVSGIGQAFPASPGESYTFDASAFVSTGDVPANDNFAVAKIVFFDSAMGGAETGADEVVIGDSASTPDVWTAYSVSATAPAGTLRVEALFLFIQPDGASPGAVFMDDASFRRINGCCEADCTFTAMDTECSAADDANCVASSACTGNSAGCPAAGAAAGSVVCRASAGPCDIEESCNGSDQGCPDDAVAPAGEVCSQGSPSACLADAECDGTGVACPPNAPIVLCINGDGCCPTTCNASSDDDCVAVCGNGRTEPGECCDDGNIVSGDGCTDECDCEANVPTVTEWGMVSLMLALLIGIAVVFGRRRQVA